MRIAVLNESPKVYNLATERIAQYHRDRGDEVWSSIDADAWARRCDKAYLSAIFNKNLPKLCRDAIELKSHGLEIEMGGPAVTAMHSYVHKETGILPHFGLDERFEQVKGKFRMTFTSRSCRNHCGWCIVHKIEPDPIEYDDFSIPVGKNPYVGDNNILGTSWEHQVHVVEKLKHVRKLDINSGFEAPLFFEEHYNLYKHLHLEGWRFAFDELERERELVRAVKILKRQHVGYRKITVYVLIGYPGSTFEDAVYRLERARELGCSPYPQRFQPLNQIDGRHYVAPGFNDKDLDALRSFWDSPETWKKNKWEDYRRNYKPVPKEQLRLMP